ncbi:unnamed protein product [Ectocarpus sp. CCAP 1310/34]|nr:unnamed protein product [Ectocarpus sp. CCAP 1310/34]
MAILIFGRRCVRLCCVAVVLLAGQRHAALGDAVASAEAVDSSKDADAVGVAPEKISEACVDPTPTLEALELAKATVQGELDDCEAKRLGLDRLMKGLEATVEKQSQVLDAAGGEKGIRELREAASAAGDATTLLQQARAEAAAAREDAEAARGEVEAAKHEAEAAKEDGANAGSEAAAARERAAQMAAEKEALQSKLDAADKELETLRKNLTRAEAKESKAREEHDRHAQEMRGKLERTASELELARKPRVVSMTAICADVKELGNNLVEQSKDARDDIVKRASEKLEMARVVVHPHYESAVEASKPVVKKAMEFTEPHRKKAGEVLAVYRGKFDESVGAPAAEKWSSGKAKISEAWQAAQTKSDESAAWIVSVLVRWGMPDQEAEKTCRYVNNLLLAMVVVALVVYFGGSTVKYFIWPVLRTVLRLALWVLVLPLRILILPVRLVLWVLLKCFRLVFGGRGAGNAAPPAAAAKGATRQSKKRR